MGDAVEPVVIIGAGPAGLACAWRLAQLGISPLLLEKAAFPREKVCGDALSGKVLALVRKLGGEAALRQLFSHPEAQPAAVLALVDRRGRALRLEFPPQQGYPQGLLLRRYAFDAWLATQLPPTVRLRTGVAVKTLLRRGSVWQIELEGQPSIYAHFVVGAEGVASRVARWVEAYHGMGRPPTFPAVRGYIKAHSPLEALELYFVPPVLPGYFWAFPMGRWWNVGVGTSQQKARLPLRTLLRTRWPAVEGLAGHGIPVALQKRPLTAPGCALIGDAAALADPFTGEGIGNALLSGIRLAEALAAFPPSTWGTLDLATAYTHRLYKELSAELRMARWLYRLAAHAWAVEKLIGVARQHPGLVGWALHSYGVKKA